MTSTTIDEGEFWLPGVQELCIILDGIKYGTVSDRNADIVNRALYKVGWVSISNINTYWLSCQYNITNGWQYFSAIGVFGYGNIFNSYMRFAVSLYPLNL